DEEQESLLFVEPADADQMARVRVDRGASIEIRLQAASDHADLVPLPVLDPSKQLAAAKGANRNHKRGPANLFRKTDKERSIELIRSVHREAKRRTAEHAHQHRNLSGVGSEMSMQVPHAGFGQPAQNQAGFNEIDHMNGEGAFRPPTH